MSGYNRQNKDTRALLLKHADELFLAHGFEGVSIRQITAAAGTNVAAVNYYFHGKTNLYREILTWHLDEITREKLAILNELDEQQPPAHLERVLSVYIRSYFDSSLTSRDNDRLLNTIYREMGPDAVASDLVEARLVRPIHQTFQETLLKACPELNEEHASFCVSSITGQVLHFIRGREVLRKIRNPDQHQTFIEDAIHHITQFSLRGIGSDQHA